MDDLDYAEKQLIEIINMLQEEHRKHLEPYIERLARIQAMKRPDPIIVDYASLDPEIQKRLDHEDQAD